MMQGASRQPDVNLKHVKDRSTSDVEERRKHVLWDGAGYACVNVHLMTAGPGPGVMSAVIINALETSRSLEAWFVWERGIVRPNYYKLLDFDPMTVLVR
jgi:hypothetical protein